MSDSAERSAGSNRTHLLRKRIAQLEAEVRAVRKQAQAQHQKIAQKCGYEFLSLVDSDRNCQVVAINIVQKLVFEDDEGMLFLKPIVL
jgi:peroxiredoxin